MVGVRGGGGGGGEIRPIDHMIMPHLQELRRSHAPYHLQKIFFFSISKRPFTSIPREYQPRPKIERYNNYFTKVLETYVLCFAL